MRLFGWYISSLFFNKTIGLNTWMNFGNPVARFENLYLRVFYIIPICYPHYAVHEVSFLSNHNVTNNLTSSINMNKIAVLFSIDDDVNHEQHCIETTDSTASHNINTD